MTAFFAKTWFFWWMLAVVIVVRWFHAADVDEPEKQSSPASAANQPSTELISVEHAEVVGKAS